MSRLAILLLFVAVACIQGAAQTPPQLYPHGVQFEKPTAAQLDSLLRLGVVPSWIQVSPAMLKEYWPRSVFTVALRATRRIYMTQALGGGFGAEANIGVPLSFTDFGLFLYARANDYTVLNRDWLGWNAENGKSGVLFNGGAGVSVDIPLRWLSTYLTVGMSVGPAFFQSEEAGPAETYVGFEPTIGARWRVAPGIAIKGVGQAAYMAAIGRDPRDIGAWNFSLGVEVSLALRRRDALQFWVPPLVTTAQDVISFLWKEPIPPLNILDRNLDFINTELKPMTTFGWTYLGFRGIVRGTIVNSSRASSGNVTALDIRIDSADRRGFRVFRTSSLTNTAGSRAVLADSSKTATTSDPVTARIARGDYAFRAANDLGVRYLRVELFPIAKGPLDLIPKAGSQIEITGEIAWDGDGHIELHPRTVSDIKVRRGEILDSDDPPAVE
jgi:hypothetical protein